MDIFAATLKKRKIVFKGFSHMYYKSAFKSINSFSTKHVKAIPEVLYKY